jgi:hypothetical protein
VVGLALDDDFDELAGGGGGGGGGGALVVVVGLALDVGAFEVVVGALEDVLEEEAGGGGGGGGGDAVLPLPGGRARMSFEACSATTTMYDDGLVVGMPGKMEPSTTKMLSVP